MMGNLPCRSCEGRRELGPDLGTARLGEGSLKAVTRRRELGTRAALASAATTGAWLASAVGLEMLAAFVAGAGSAIAEEYVVLTNMAIRQARSGVRSS